METGINPRFNVVRETAGTPLMWAKLAEALAALPANRGATISDLCGSCGGSFDQISKLLRQWVEMGWVVKEAAAFGGVVWRATESLPVLPDYEGAPDSTVIGHALGGVLELHRRMGTA